MKPQNELERLLMARHFGPQFYPDVFRLLRASPLVFFLPYHPELPGTSDTVRNGDLLPPFVIWESEEQGRTIPVFSSPHLARKAWRTVGVEDSAYVMGEMSGQDLFELLSFQPDSIVINPACSSNTMYLDVTAVKKLADGSILDPEGGEMKEGIASIVDPADYPTDFLQPLFYFLRGRPEVRAAWLLQEDTEPGVPISYVFVLQVTGQVLEVERDFRVVARSACPPNVGYGVTFFDPANESLVQLTREAMPFFAAPDFRGPNLFGDEGLSSAA